MPQYVWRVWGCFTNVLQALQNNLAKIYNAINHIYGENFELKLCACAHSFGHTHKVSAWNSHKKYDFCKTQIRENILERSRNVSETPPGPWAEDWDF